MVQPKKQEQGGQSTVPEDEIKIEFVRSSGPGGQNVNKRATKAVLSWDVGASAAFSEEQKEMIRRELGNRLNSEDCIVMSSQSERSQMRNQEDVIRRLQNLVVEAITPQKERRPTKPSRVAKARRLDDKRKMGRKKDLRGKVDHQD
ncbi:hypothetical protein A2480_04375 [Candidatus Uhrbacteria bacterium RIFOXYC2_FULL_47_19]|uniref:Prokaryotic-type class I peptide chain release factors domain-containing protein n=1 Tax=Candidatus Uhrbacteria bacterium RIFOXYC2_FULL_47_19 TaxID=1802424 RepID=A0A1F7WF79_9BACT|nr:MAG: hypothetical protein A2480_04375 [Candidatus Uhrbacteria bacterium RIFOXYC2_FULL_47_19]